MLLCHLVSGLGLRDADVTLQLDEFLATLTGSEIEKSYSKELWVIFID